MSKSWRVKLAGRPYVFGNSPGIVLGAGLTDPGRPAEVGSAVIASLHPGIGHGLANQLMRYKSASNVDVTIPGEVLPGYAPTDVGDPVTADGQVLARPKFAFVPDDLYNRAFVISGQHLWQFSPTDPSGGLTDILKGDADPLSTDLTDREFSGASFALGNRLFFGVIYNGAAATPSFNYHPMPHYWVNLEADPADMPGTASPGIGGVQMSYCTSSRGRAFYVSDNGTSGRPSLYWAPENPDAAAQDFDLGTLIIYPTSGSGFALGDPHVSWLAMIGRSLLIFRSDGVILAADESGLLSEAGRIAISDPDPYFGQGACVFQDGVLFGSGSGLWSFDLRTLTMRPAGLNYIQNQSEERLRGEITATASAGPYAFVGTAGPSRKGIGYMIVRYSNMMGVHDLIPELGTNELITDFLPYFDRESAMTRLYYIVFNESTKAIQVRCKFLRLPSDSGVSETPADGEIDLASFPAATAEGLALKLWTQVRGHVDLGSGDTDTTSLSFENFTVDDLDVDIAGVFATGPFMRQITSSGTEGHLLGREISTGKIKLNNPLVDTEIRLPLVFDYVWVPSAANACVLDLLVSGEVNGENAALWTKAPWDTTKTLLALRNTITTLEFPEGDTWHVLVQDVQISDIPVPDSEGQTARVAKVQVRRID